MNGTPGIHGLHIPDPCSHAAACCWLRPGGSWSRYANAAGFHGPSLNREHGCLHFSGRQAHPQYLRQMSKVRLDQLKRDPRNGSLSILRRRANGRGCILQFDRCGSANPHDAGRQRRRRTCTHERLFRLVLRASSVPPFPRRRFGIKMMAKSGQCTASYVYNAHYP